MLSADPRSSAISVDNVTTFGGGVPLPSSRASRSARRPRAGRRDARSRATWRRRAPPPPATCGLSMLIPTPTMPIGLPASSVSVRPRPSIQCTEPSGHWTRCSKTRSSPGLAGGFDAPRGMVAVLGVDELQVSLERPVELAGSEPVQALPWRCPIPRHPWPCPQLHDPHVHRLEREGDLLLPAAKGGLRASDSR